jgi:NADPH:quinone reductase-like Zn-dependent oxidoreductase
VIYALLDVGRLRRGMSVLVHSACGGVGLAAMELIARMFGDGDGDGGVTVYCTVGTEGKVEHLVQRFGVPRDRIVSSRDAAFLDKIMAVTNGNGVDLVLNSLSGELLHASWRCVARGGQLLELGKRDLVASAKLDMALFLEGRSYCGIDLAYLCEHQEEVTTEYVPPPFPWAMTHSIL